MGKIKCLSSNSNMSEFLVIELKTPDGSISYNIPVAKM